MFSLVYTSSSLVLIAKEIRPPGVAPSSVELVCHRRPLTCFPLQRTRKPPLIGSSYAQQPMQLACSFRCSTGAARNRPCRRRYLLFSFTLFNSERRVQQLLLSVKRAHDSGQAGTAESRGGDKNLVRVPERDFSDDHVMPLAIHGSHIFRSIDINGLIVNRALFVQVC